MNEEANYLSYIIECELINVERMIELENYTLLNLVVKFLIGMGYLHSFKDSPPKWLILRRKIEILQSGKVIDIT